VDYKILDIFLLTPTARSSRPRGGISQDRRAKLRIAPGQGIVGAAAVPGPVFVPDVSRDRRYLPLAPGVVAEMAIPHAHRDRLAGVLNIERSRPERRSSPEARTAMQVIARHRRWP
jgi:putative methionine-R-sulfoxide reductase with GAF domain